jgi:serine/threonine protein kinase
MSSRKDDVAHNDATETSANAPERPGHATLDNEPTIFGATAPGPKPGNRRVTVGTGTTIGTFRVVRLLGHGGMGSVWLARDLTLGRHVALKIVRADQANKDAMERFLHEARATATFSHPHIVSIYSVGEHEGVPCVALEYLEGDSLRERLRGGRPGVREALRMAHAMADALVEAHRRGLLHRDLKPENVVLPRDGRLRVVDFGLAMRIDQQDPTIDVPLGADDTDPDPAGARDVTDGGIVRGTPAYMAPEQWRGHPSEKSDVWALGVVMIEMLRSRVRAPEPRRVAPARGAREARGGGGPRVGAGPRRRHPRRGA